MNSMMMGPLGLALHSSLGLQQPSQAVPAIPSPKPVGKGQLIAGVLADALAGAIGRPGTFAHQMVERRQEDRQQAQWGLRRRAELEDYEAKQQIEQRYAKPDVSPMERDAKAWLAMTPELRKAYEAVQAAKPQFIPDGMGGGQWVRPQSPSSPSGPPAGVTFTPLDDGGPTLPASGGFPR